MLTYFCGGVRDTYKLTNSRFAVVRFMMRPIILNFEHRHFRILIKGRIKLILHYTEISVV